MNRSRATEASRYEHSLAHQIVRAWETFRKDGQALDPRRFPAVFAEASEVCVFGFPTGGLFDHTRIPAAQPPADAVVPSEDL